MFLDKVKITCKAGNGGDGRVSFLSDKHKQNGGPDGGNGGNGGSIIFKATTNMTNLSTFRFDNKFKAENGEMGGKRNCFGKSAKDLIINVPIGTIIKNASTNKVLADMSGENTTFKLLKGGHGGRGNSFYATSTRQAPNFCEPGEKTKEFEIILELKTIADVGLVGYPNVGKSSFLSAVSNCRPKIANYHFTTLTPNIGIVNMYDESFVVADIPGLIEGASEGTGLGLDFLRHIERTRLLIHIVDISGSEGRDPFKDYLTINNELKKYSAEVFAIPQIIALNKIDLSTNYERAVLDFKRQLSNKIEVYPISTVAYLGIENLVRAVAEKLKKLPKKGLILAEEFDIDRKTPKTFEVIKKGSKYYEVVGDLIDRITFGVIVTDYASFSYFQKNLKETGVMDKLLESGLKEGDTVKIKDIEFEYVV